MTAAEARSQLNHAGSVRPDPDLGVRRAVPDRRAPRPRRGRPRSDLVLLNTRPRVRQRDAERRRVGGEAVGDEERVEDAVDRDGLTVTSGPSTYSSTMYGAVPRGLDAPPRSPPGAPPRCARSVSPRWPWRSGALTTQGATRLVEQRAAAGRPAAAKRSRCLDFVVDERRGRGVDRMRKPEPLGDPRGDAHGPVRARARRSRRRSRRARGGRSPARPRWRRARACPRRRSRAPRDRGRPRSRTGRARAPRAGARSAPAPLLGRGDAVAGARPSRSSTRPRSRGTRRPSARARRSKLVRARQPVSRSSLSVEPMWRSTWPSRSSTKTFSTSAPTAASTASATSRDGDVDPGRDVHDLAGEHVDVRRDDRLDRLGVVVDVEPVAARVPVAVDRQRLARRAPA